ncbi:probable WRKY transcription factor 53 [Cucurbita pepo subsp. pepo]|uniref:probable WRKY transcription factor 53 n=1 Tax=Cucurbita pepo subsp. pepo TaxID=3664 RepID=UPI000C9D5D2F|nr:probable WRKY transcription factor 53 [Cucurbita pepo subsp. pepo]
MENLGEWERKNLQNELLKGKEFARQLRVHLNVRPSTSSMAAAASSSSSYDGVELLVQKILSSYEKALSLLSSTKSPSSLNANPRSEDSDHIAQTNAASRKRNILPTWTLKFQVTPGMALEGSLDDGFSWRKYGQKGIFGAKHPRGYYRCTRRNLQGCVATKQVQRSDDDPTIFKITYRGNHTCSQVSNLGTTPAAPEFQQQNRRIDQNLVQSQQTSPDALLNSWASLRIITENLDTVHEPILFPPFSYDPTSSYEAADRIESTSTVDMNFTEFSPSFLSPTKCGSGVSYFSGSSSEMSEGFIGNQKLESQPRKSELPEIFSSPTSGVNSRTLGLDFPSGELQMEPSFTFDNTTFFS